MDSLMEWTIFVNLKAMYTPKEWPLLLVLSGFTLLWIFGSQWVKNRRLPPGPFALPVIGNLHMLGKRSHRTLTKMAEKHGPVMFLRLGSVPALVISTSEAAKLFFKSHDQAFSGRPNDLVRKCIFYDNKDMALCEYGDEWRHRRKICTSQLISSVQIESMRPGREEEAASMINKLWTASQEGSGIVNISEVFFTYSFDSFWRGIARKGFPDRSQELIKLISRITVIMIQGSLSDFIPLLSWLELGKRKMAHCFSEFDRLASIILQEHMAAGKPSSEEETSLIDVLLKISEGDPQFTHDNIKGLLMDLVAAATDVTGATLEWTTCLLLTNPRCLKVLQQEIEDIVGSDQRVTEAHLAEMKYLKCAVKESMRLYPAGPLGIPRESTEAVVVDGYEIPKGTRLMLNIWAIGRDPNVWEKPDEFIPERFAEIDHIDFTGWSDFKSLPFGAGRRGCPGAKLALPTIMLGVATLFHTFDVSIDDELDMTEKDSLTITRETPLLGYLKLRPNASKVYC